MIFKKDLTKFAIGCLVQWYEMDIIGEYVDSLRDAINAYDGPIDVHMTLSMGQQLEKTTLTDEEMAASELRIYAMFQDLQRIRDGVLVMVGSETSIYSIADYRREFNHKFCEFADVLVWGESDMLIPKQAFVILDQLHQMSLQRNAPKYLATFGICKMWDDSWKPLEHPDFTDKLHSDSTSDWWGVRYTMTRDEMNEINSRTDEVDLCILPRHKFNGCGLVISSEVIKAGVNIPKSVFFVHEDTAFMWITNKVLGNIPQYVIKNILLVHNRKHPNKRMYIKGEEGIEKTDPGAQRRSHCWYTKANKMCEENYINLFNPNYKSFTWEDVWK